jgi:hypothetical protein
MKRLTLFFLIFLFSYSCYSQLMPRSTTITTLNPTWRLVKREDIRKNGVKQDSVFYFNSKENNRDSALIMIQYFDSLGNFSERDEYSVKNKGEIVRVTRQTYMDDELFQSEILTKKIGLINHIVHYEKELHTYEFDSAGNNIVEKLYEFFGDSLNKYRLFVTENLYDSASHIVKSFAKAGGSDRYLHKVYKYNSGILDEVKAYDSNREEIYTNVYRTDDKRKISRIYLTDVSPDNLQLEYLYDDKNRVKQEKWYNDGVNKVTQTYLYDPKDLIEMQTVKSENDGAKYYYKHYYSRQ